MATDRILLSELARILDRRPNTIRLWEPDLPQKLLPKRTERGWRYWTPAQVDGIKLWMERNKRVPGGHLNHFNPSVDKVQEMLGKLRGPRKRRRKCPICGDISHYSPPFDTHYVCPKAHRFTEEEFQKKRRDERKID